MMSVRADSREGRALLNKKMESNQELSLDSDYNQRSMVPETFKNLKTLLKVAGIELEL